MFYITTADGRRMTPPIHDVVDAVKLLRRRNRYGYQVRDERGVIMAHVHRITIGALLGMPMAWRYADELEIQRHNKRLKKAA